MSKVCQITGRRVQGGNNVSHSKRRTKRTFAPNLRMKRYYLASEERSISWGSKLLCEKRRRRVSLRFKMSNAMEVEPCRRRAKM